MRHAGLGFCLLFALINAGTAAGQDKTALRGTVTDDEGRRIEGATLEILGTKLSATTTATGDFRFDQVPAGRYWIIARRIGYAPIRLTATLEAGIGRDLPIEMERIPERLSELTVLAHGGMSNHRYQDFFIRSHAAFGKFLTRDDLAKAKAFDLVAVIQRHLPGKTRFALERRTGDRRVGALYTLAGYSTAEFSSSSTCGPAISVNGATPRAGVALTDFSLDQVEAVEVYRRGSWVPTEFAYRETSGCGLVVIWTR